MGFRYIHTNINVSDLNKSIAFYEEALGLKEVGRKEAQDGSFILVYLAGDGGEPQLELTWLAEHPQKYELGENETHIAYETGDYAEAHKKHKAMNCICYENPTMGIYFIEDPEGYWVEILPVK